MKLLDFVETSATVASLKAGNKKDVITELIEALVSKSILPRKLATGALRAVMKRENLGSTGIGRGVAIPHARMEGIDEVLGVVGRSVEGIDFASLDGEPAYVFFLLLSPAEKPDPHLKALEHISKVLRDNHFCRFMKRAESSKELNELLAEADEKFFAKV